AYLRAAGLVLRENRRRVAPFALGAGDGFASGVLVALESFDERNQPPPLGLERREIGQRGSRLRTARAQSLGDFIEMFADVRRIEHRSTCYQAASAIRCHL